jgi:phospholipid/cholesterol/gamma-HCH transport system substrate-binding protein
MRGPIAGLRGHAAVVAVSTVVVGAFVVALIAMAGAFDGFKDRYRLHVVVPDAVSLAAKSDVRIAGLRVGRVTDVSRRGNTAVVTLDLERRYAPVRSDARVQVRLRTLVGENYVELYPGRARGRAIPDGGLLPMQQTLDATQVDTVLDTLDAPTRARARRLLRGLGDATSGRGKDLNRLLEGTNDSFDAAPPVTETLARERERLVGVVDDLGTLMADVGARGDDVRTLVHRGVRTARALASRDRALRRTFAAMPAALHQIRRTAGVLRDVSRTTAPVLGELASTVREADPAATLLAPAAQEGRDTVRQLRLAATPLQKTLADVRRVSPAGTRALPQVGAVLRELNPALKHLSPYWREAGAFFVNFKSASNYYDATGNALRNQADVSEASAMTWPDELYDVVKAIYSTGLVRKIRTLGNNAYPAPGVVGRMTEFTGKYPRLEPEPPSK